MKADHLSKGDIAEQLAQKHLQKAGVKIIATNVSSRFGEIDIIGQEKKELIFVEVRYRSHENFGSAAETVSIHKQKKITKAAQHFLNQNPKLNAFFMRFDVIGIDAKNNIEWIKGAFLATV